jgi:hypothetical protein
MCIGSKNAPDLNQHRVQMELKFSTHSRFFAPIRAALTSHSLDQGALEVELGPRGYERDVTVHIRRDDTHVFETDWAGRDPSRFSARIRAAATVLSECGFHGVFRISHIGGLLRIERIMHAR